VFFMYRTRRIKSANQTRSLRVQADPEVVPASASRSPSRSPKKRCTPASVSSVAHTPSTSSGKILAGR
jgi:hypothetical protein